MIFVFRKMGWAGAVAEPNEAKTKPQNGEEWVIQMPTAKTNLN